MPWNYFWNIQINCLQRSSLNDFLGLPGKTKFKDRVVTKYEFLWLFFSFLRNLYFYLDALCQKDWETSKKFHGFLVGLYADYAPEKLLRFLKNSDNYPIQVRCFNDTHCVWKSPKKVSPNVFHFFRFCLFFNFVSFSIF